MQKHKEQTNQRHDESVVVVVEVFDASSQFLSGQRVLARWLGRTRLYGAIASRFVAQTAVCRVIARVQIVLRQKRAVSNAASFNNDKQAITIFM